MRPTFVLLLALFSGGIAVAAEKGDVGASAAAREGKSAYVGAEVGSGILLFSEGAEAGYFFGPKLSAGVSYIQSSVEVGSLFKLEASLVALRANYFFGNSFYATAGLGLRTLSMDLTMGSVVPTEGDLKVSAKVTNVGLDAGIGNRWQWDGGFYLGVEWGGYFAPVSSTGDDKVKVPAGADVSDAEATQKDVDRYANAGTVHLMRLGMGWMF